MYVLVFLIKWRMTYMHESNKFHAASNLLALKLSIFIKLYFEDYAHMFPKFCLCITKSVLCI